MKKLVIVCLIGIVIASLVGCSSSQNKSAGTAKPNNLVIVTAGPGGTMYYMGTGQAKIISEKLPGISMNNESTSGTPVENCSFVSKRTDTIGMTNLDGINAAYTGMKERGFDKPLTNLRIMQVGHTQILYMVTLQNTGIKTIGDIKGKKVALPSAGNTAYYQALGILKAYGVTEKDYKGTPMTFTEGADALKDGVVDVAMVAGSIPQASVTDLNTTKDIRILSIEPDKLKGILSQNPGWNSMVIKGGTYSKQKEDVNVVTVKAVLMCNSSLDEELVYKITKTLNENVAMMKAIHTNGSEWSKENTKATYENSPVPFHPGAIKYYKEVFGK